MKNTISLFIAAAMLCPLLSSAQNKLAGKIFKPVTIETNGQKTMVSPDSIPFAMEFIDEKNIVYREMKSNYYVLHHCVYKIKDNSLAIEFLNKKRPSVTYLIQSMDADQLQLKDADKTIYLSKARD